MRVTRRRALWSVVWLGLLAYGTGASAAEEKVGEGRAFSGEVVILRGAKVRLAGLAAPSPEETCSLDGAVRPCAEAAKQVLGALLEGRELRCSLDRKVGHGSYQGRCRLADGSDLGETLVRRGWARAEGPGADGYGSAEAAAKSAGEGIWAGVNKLLK